MLYFHRHTPLCLLATALFCTLSLPVMADGLAVRDNQAQRFPWLAGLPDGYLQLAAPNSLEISPPPPEPGSLWAQLDAAVAQEALALRGSAAPALSRRGAMPI